MSMFRLQPLKPRNPVAPACRRRGGGGAHRRSESSRRQAQAREMRRGWFGSPAP